MPIILITGGTGLIGSALSKYLSKDASGEFEIRILTRNKYAKSPFKSYLWNIDENYIDPEALKDVDAIIHLAGENIGEKRWSAERKKQIIDSRVKSTELLVRTLQNMSEHKVKTFIAASAIGYYGDAGSKIVDENSPAGDNFMAEICEKWEFASFPIEKMGIRRIIVRNGIVLSTKGRTLNMMMKSYPFRIGLYVGTGGPYISWIHILDICHIYKFLLTHENCKGIYNAVSPQPERNNIIANAIAEALKQKTLLLPVPSFMAKLVLGEMSEVLLASIRVAPKALETEGFTFEFRKIYPALKDLIEKGI